MLKLKPEHEKKSSKSGTKSARHKSIYLVFFLSYMSILLISMSSSVILFGRHNQETTKRTEQTRQALLNQLSEKTVDYLNNVNNYSMRLANNNKLISLAKKLTVYTPNQVMEELKFNRLSYIDECVVYLAERDEVLTSTLHMNSSRFFNSMFDIQDMPYADVYNQYFTGLKYQKWMPMVKVSWRHESSTNYNDVIPYVISFPINPDGSDEDVLGQILLFIDPTALKKTIEEIAAISESSIFIYDNNNNVILSSENSSKNPEIDETIKSLTQQQFDDFAFSNKALLTLQTKKDIIDIKPSLTSGDKNWKYVIVTAKSEYYKANIEYGFFFATIFTIYILIGFFVVRLLSKRAYRPIKEIHSLATIGGTENIKGKNEIETIKNSILDQIRNDEKLNKLLEWQSPFVKRDTIMRLILGTESSLDDISAHLIDCGVTFVSDYFYTVLVDIDPDSPFILTDDGNKVDNIALAKIVVENVGSELLETEFLTYFLETTPYRIVILLNLKSENIKTHKSSEKSIVSHMNTLTELAEERFRIYLNMGISNLHTGMKYIPTGFDEASKAVETSHLRGGQDVVHFGSIEDYKADYYYPTETELQLITCLKSGNGSQTRELLDKIFDINQVTKKLDKHSTQVFLKHLASTFDMILSAIDNSVVTSVSQLITSDMSLESGKKVFEDCITSLSLRPERESISKTEKLVEDIALFIDENAGILWIDLNELSEKFNVTPQYISNVFKKFKDENVKDYIAKRLLQIAKSLLLETDMSIKDIAQQLGYSNEVGIIRIFRKYERMTPGQYRKLYSEDIKD